MEKLIDLMRKAIKLKSIKRKGWLRRGIENAESVADHTFMLAFLAMMVGDFLGMDTEKMVKMALLHDIAESVTGDITPHEMERGEKVRMEENIMKKMMEGMEEMGYYEIWKEFMEGRSREAEMVRQLDKLEMILQAHQYSEIYGKEKVEEFMEEKVENPMLVSIIKKWNSLSSSSNINDSPHHHI